MDRCSTGPEVIMAWEPFLFAVPGMRVNLPRQSHWEPSLQTPAADSPLSQLPLLKHKLHDIQSKPKVLFPIGYKARKKANKMT